jgi:tetratricopeptide (TPR) repeat protein
LEDSPRCPTCHESLSSCNCPVCDAAAAQRLAQRQLLILAALVATCVVLFLFTREAAARLERTRIQTAATWYARGQAALAAGDEDGAMAAFRAAMTNDPGSLPYSLALADALTAGARHDQARTLLLRVREEAPDDPRINTRLARLAAAGGDLPVAIRYYQNALYGAWDTGEDEAQRRLRIELIRLLLQRADRESALSQILVLSKNVPGEVEAYVQVGQLFLDARAPADAAEAFDRALQLEPAGGAALAGAGEALFQLADYAPAQRYLRAAVQAGAGLPGSAARLEVVRLILAGDPMAPRLSSNDRQRRLGLLLDRAVERLEACRLPAPEPALLALLAEATALRDSLGPGSVRRDPNLPETGVELIGRVEAFAAVSCGPGTPLDEALGLIARRRADTSS